MAALYGFGLSKLIRRANEWTLAAERLVPTLLACAAAVLLFVLGTEIYDYGVLAAAAANGGLWYLLSQAEGWGLLEHPQLWFIPPALCVFAAAYLNRAHLNEAQLATIRYAAAIVIYVSSTADIFLTGVAEAPWLPIVLAALSLVTGILMIAIFAVFEKKRQDVLRLLVELKHWQP